MSTVLVCSANTLFRECLVNFISGVDAVQSVEGIDTLTKIKEGLKASYDFIFIDFFSRVIDGCSYDMIREMSNNCDTVIVTTKENYIRNYFINYIGAKHFIYADDDGDSLNESISAIFHNRISKCKKVPGVLTLRECEILKYIAEGKTSKEISETLCISKNTVDTHRNKMLQKLNMANSASLVHFAHRHGLI